MRNNSKIIPLFRVAMARLRSHPLGGQVDLSDLDSCLQALFTKITYFLSCDGVRLGSDWVKLATIKFVQLWNRYPTDWQRITRLQSSAVPMPLDYGRTVFRNVLQIEDLVDSEACDFIERMKELWHILERPEVSQEQWDSVYEVLVVEGFLGQLIKTFKVEINTTFGKYFQTDIPKTVPTSLGKFIFPRDVNLHFRRLVLNRNSRKLKDMFQVYTLFQGLKKGLLPIRPDAVDDSLLDHKKALTRDVPLTDKFKWFVNEILHREFKDVVVQPENHWNSNVLTGKNETRFFSRKKKLFSNHSTVSGTRSTGGQVGIARKLHHLTDHQFLQDKLVLPEPDEFLGFVEEDTTVKYRSTGEIYSRCRVLRPMYGYPLTDRDIFNALDYGRKRGLIPIGYAEPCVILEPLKGRIITKPSDGDYLDLGDIQKFLFDVLSRRREFALCGRPVTTEDIYFVAGSWEWGMKFNSGDYSGATDNLSGYLSSQILRWILSKCSKDFSDSVEESFCHAKLDYRNDPMKEGDSPWLDHYGEFECVKEGVVEQINGQLMGHILSFPILCLANYIVFRYVYWKREEKAPNCLVNGDDILFCATDDQYKDWSQEVNSIGFIPSLGKNLFQCDIAQINSVLFAIRFDEVELGRSFVRKIEPVPYVNFGVLTGRGKGKENPFDRASMQECERELDDFAPEITSLHANLSTFKYVEKFVDRKRLLDVFYKNRPRTSYFLKECEGLPESFVRTLFSTTFNGSDAHRIPKNSYSSFIGAIGGDSVFNLGRNVRFAVRNPFAFWDFELDERMESRLR